MEIKNETKTATELTTTAASKLSTFCTELNYIKNEKVHSFVEKCLTELVPDYFFEVPASSTGKYHPAYALGSGGLIRHTKAAVRIAKGLFTIMSINETDQDNIIAALILHDSFKHGKIKSTYTIATHPKVAATEICDFARQNSCEEVALPICELILTHMGQWNKDYYGNVILPVPVTSLQHFVHMCDYLASRKYLEFNFEVTV